MKVGKICKDSFGEDKLPANELVMFLFEKSEIDCAFQVADGRIVFGFLLI